MHLTDEIIMQRCLDLASRGLGRTAPNPMVGAVIVRGEQVIGEGFHNRCGGDHAEVNAVEMVSDPQLLKESALYINLEPCNHQGKTPPCTDLILRMGIPKVIIGQGDPNPLVPGGGINRLRENGVDVVTGILEKECRFLNRRFNTYHEQKRPYIILKWAQTRDGFVDTLRDTPGAHPTWITDETCRRLVHKWRSEEQAIMAGSRTILLDNPQLNVRAWSGKNPVRITIDRPGKIVRARHAGSLHILDGSEPTLVFTCEDQASRVNLEFLRITAEQPVWPQVFSVLYERGIQSVLVEGGPVLLKSLIDCDSWDEARVFTGPVWFGRGVKALEFPFAPSSSETVGNSEIMVFYKTGR